MCRVATHRNGRPDAWWASTIPLRYPNASIEASVAPALAMNPSAASNPRDSTSNMRPHTIGEASGDDQYPIGPCAEVPDRGLVASRRVADLGRMRSRVERVLTTLMLQAIGELCVFAANFPRGR